MDLVRISFFFSILFLILLTIGFIDYERGIIPNKITIFGAITGFIFSIADGFSTFQMSLIGGITGGLILYIFRFLGNKFFGKESMGLGDIKLGSMVGIFLKLKLTLISIYFSFLLSLFFGMFLIIKKKSFSIKPIPFGTFISIGVYISVFYGEKLYNYYLNYIN